MRKWGRSETKLKWQKVKGYKIKGVGFIATLSTLVQSPLDLFTEQEKIFSNHTIRSWNIVCKPSPLILFSHTKMDTNANTLFAVFNYCNPAAEGISWDNTVSDIWQSIKGFLSLCNCEITIEMTEIPKFEPGYKTMPSLLSPVQTNPQWMLQSNQPVQFLVLLKYFLDGSHSRIGMEKCFHLL